jgi:hypothetical protein
MIVMQPFSLALSDDGTQLTVSANADVPSVCLSVAAVDELIRALADHRARMKPVHPAEPPSEPDRVYTGDNLLWSVRAAPRISALELGIQHPGLGWITMPLSRAQVEDLVASFAFSLQDLPPARAKGPNNS